MSLDSERSFWEYVFSDTWSDASSLRVTEGDMLERLLHGLHHLLSNKSLQTYKMARFDVIKRLLHNPLRDKRGDGVDAGKLRWHRNHVKLTFTYYALPSVNLQPTDASDFSSRWSLDTIPTCTTDADPDSGSSNHHINDKVNSQGHSETETNDSDKTVTSSAKKAKMLESTSIADRPSLLPDIILTPETHEESEGTLTRIKPLNMLNRTSQPRYSRATSIFYPGGEQSIYDTVTFFDHDTDSHNSVCCEERFPLNDDVISAEGIPPKMRVADTTEHVSVLDKEEEKHSEIPKTAFFRKDASSLAEYFERKHSKLKNKTGLLNPLLVSGKHLGEDPCEEMTRLGLKIPWMECKIPMLKKPPYKPRQSMHFRFGSVKNTDLNSAVLAPVQCSPRRQQTSVNEAHYPVTPGYSDAETPGCTAWLPLMRPTTRTSGNNTRNDDVTTSCKTDDIMLFRNDDVNVQSRNDDVITRNDDVSSCEVIDEAPFVPLNPDCLKKFHSLENKTKWQRFERYKSEIQMTDEKRTQIYSVLNPLVEDSMVPRVMPPKPPRKYKLKPGRQRKHRKVVSVMTRETDLPDEEPHRLFMNDSLPEFDDFLLRAVQDYVIRKEQVTSADGWQTVTSVTINRRPCYRYGQI